MKQNILLVVADPDVESLWFYGGLKRLSKKFNVDILCLTISSESALAREIQNSTMHLSVQVKFANLKVDSQSGLIRDLESTIGLYLNVKYKLVVTHPPHGGEKLLPQQIQCFHIVRRLAKRAELGFGFFSEKPLLSKLEGKYRFRFTLTDHIRWTLEYWATLLDYDQSIEIWLEVGREFLFVLFEMVRRKSYYLFSYYPDIFRKKRPLASIKPGGADSRASLLSSAEYLYLEKR